MKVQFVVYAMVHATARLRQSVAFHWPPGRDSREPLDSHNRGIQSRGSFRLQYSARGVLHVHRIALQIRHLRTQQRTAFDEHGS